MEKIGRHIILSVLKENRIRLENIKANMIEFHRKRSIEFDAEKLEIVDAANGFEVTLIFWTSDPLKREWLNGFANASYCALTVN